MAAASGLASGALALAYIMLATAVESMINKPISDVPAIAMLVCVCASTLIMVMSVAYWLVFYG